MIECLKRIIREYQNLELPGGLLPRRVAIGSLPGKVSVVTGVRGSGKTTLLRQRIHQLIESGVPRENTLHLDLLPTTGFTGCGTKPRTSSWRPFSNYIRRNVAAKRSTAFLMRFRRSRTGSSSSGTTTFPTLGR
jgi:GTPase SAR1 family protein